MRIAFCLFGDTHQTVIGQSNIDEHDTDIFIHSWSVNHKDELLEIYKPRDYEIVEQTQFGSDASKYGLVGQDMAKWKLRPSTMESYKLLLQSHGSVESIIDDMQDLSSKSESQWWSSKRVLEQKKKYEQEHGFKYDLVVLSRLDNVFKQRILFDEFDPSKFYGQKRLGSPDQMYAYFDYWFVSGSENMDKFASLYDNRYNYSVMPMFACREHVVKTLGNGAVAYFISDLT